jgi:hypothetical protein
MPTAPRAEVGGRAEQTPASRGYPAVAVVLDLHATTPQKNTRPSKPPSRSWPIRALFMRRCLGSVASPFSHLQATRYDLSGVYLVSTGYCLALLWHLRLVHHHRILLYLLSGVHLNMMFLSWKLNKHRVFQTALVLKQYVALLVLTFQNKC